MGVSGPAEIAVAAGSCSEGAGGVAGAGAGGAGGAGAGVGDLGRWYPMVLMNRGCPLMRGSSSQTVDQSGTPLILPLGPQLSRISAAHDSSMGDNEVAAAPKRPKEVDCTSIRIE